MVLHSLSGGRALDRLINFTDAVVAVAITLMVLPLVDLEKVEGESIGEHVSANKYQFATFLFTFAVVSVQWRAHTRILDKIEGYDIAVFWLNTLWMMGIVLLPIASSMPHQVTPSNGAWCAYWLSLAFITLVAGVMFWHINRHPDMTGGTTRSDAWWGRLRSLGFLTCFIIQAVVSVWSPEIASYLALLLIPLSILLPSMRDDAGHTDQLELSSATGPEDDA
jgi:uncharacterized membrane protein